jgi:hypothetical protein
MSGLRAVVFLFVIGVLFSCKKKDTQSVLGLDVQPENDLLGVTITDSTSLFMHTQKIDSVRTYNDQYKFIGSIQDPVFGQTHASLYTNFSIVNNLTNVSYGSNPVMDSSEIVLRFADQYSGSFNQELTYDIYLLNEKIQSGVSYYSNKDFSKTKVASVKTKPVSRNGLFYLVLPFDDNLAQYIIQTTSNLTSNTAFIDAYKGIYITTSNSNVSPVSQGSLIRYNLDDDFSGINIYYHDGNSVSSKTKTAQFPFKGTDAQRLNHFDHNYYAAASTNLFEQVLNNDTTKGNNSVYLNSFGGTRVKVHLPFIKNFTDSEHVSISRAELILKVDKNSLSSAFRAPDQLALIATGPEGVEELVYDQLEITDFTKYGGGYDTTYKYYKFNIARQMQKIITGKIYNYGFYLVNALSVKTYVAKRDSRLERVVFGGKNNPAFTPVFRVTYIKYPYDK